MRTSDAAAETHQETDHGADEKNDKQYLGDTSGTDCNSAKPEDGGNECDDEEDYGIVKHDDTFC
jgi:hypothetical protein